MEFVYEHIRGGERILNIGVGDDPALLGDEAVHLDIDPWQYTYFVQADAHHLPFKSDSFDTVILADVVEHLVDPLKALLEAKRVGHRLVITIFEEWRLGGPGQHIDKAREVFGEANLGKYIEEGKLLTIVPEEVISHNPHINQFTDGGIDNLVKLLHMRVIEYSKEPEWIHEGHTWYNWLLCLEKG